MCSRLPQKTLFAKVNGNKLSGHCSYRSLQCYSERIKVLIHVKCFDRDDFPRCSTCTWLRSFHTLSWIFLWWTIWIYWVLRLITAAPVMFHGWGIVAVLKLHVAEFVTIPKNPLLMLFLRIRRGRSITSSHLRHISTALQHQPCATVETYFRWCSGCFLGYLCRLDPRHSNYFHTAGRQ